MALRPDREIAFPFHIGPNGGVAYVDAPEQIHNQHLVQLMLTRPGERRMLPDFGTEVGALLFENVNEVTGVEIRERVAAAIRRWEPAIRLHDVRPSLRGMGDNVFTVQVLYSVPPRDEVLSTLVEVGGAVRETLDG